MIQVKHKKSPDWSSCLTKSPGHRQTRLYNKHLDSTWQKARAAHIQKASTMNSMNSMERRKAAFYGITWEIDTQTNKQTSRWKTSYIFNRKTMYHLIWLYLVIAGIIKGLTNIANIQFEFAGIDYWLKLSVIQILHGARQRFRFGWSYIKSCSTWFDTINEAYLWVSTNSTY